MADREGLSTVGKSGTFTNPYKTEVDDTEMKCIWTISVPSEYRIKLIIKFFKYNILSSITVLDGKPDNYQIVCGPCRYFKITSITNNMIIKFESSNIRHETSFSAEYIALEKCKLVFYFIYISVLFSLYDTKLNQK